MRNWERKAAEHRLQQMRAHQLREDPPTPVVRERKPRISKVGDHWFLIHRDSVVNGFTLWTQANDRMRLYEAALGG